MERWVARLRGKEDPFLKIGQTNDRTTKGDSNIVYSLQDINFNIQQGDAVGIIGRNGAGKSTLLKILSRVTSPTTGRINIKGRVASLLEVGTGFHPELTGRENIYLNGAILGMRKNEINRKLDEIIDFSGVERYIDTPVKRYSSGMYVRLAFAVAAHLESEILIVDEVLAVGDAEFQKKCLGKMSDVSKGEGRTVLFVSHNMAAVEELCNNAIIMENGLISHFGGVSHSIDLYYQGLQKKKATKIIFLVKYQDDSKCWKVDEKLELKLIFEKKYQGYFVDISFYDKNGIKQFSVEGKNAKERELQINNNSEITLIIVNPGFVNGSLSVDIGLKKDHYSNYEILENGIGNILTKDISTSSIINGIVLPKIYICENEIDRTKLLG
jgi:lipopolysaccharide transport system ATP-binding protein